MSTMTTRSGSRGSARLLEPYAIDPRTRDASTAEVGGHTIEQAR